MSLIHEVSDIFKDKIYPDRWQKIELNKVVKIQNGYAFKSSNFNSEKIGMPLIRIRDIKESTMNTYYDGEILNDFIVVENDLLVGMDGDFNSNLWKGFPALLNQRVCRLIPNEEIILKKLIYYGLPEFLNKINENTSSTTVKHLSSKSIGEIPFPLPPLAEQSRIVTKLDALFAQLETIKTSMAKVPLLLKDFRQQVLTQAVTGKLTEEWRKGKELDSINVDLSKINLKELSKVTLKPLDFKFELPQKWEWYNLHYLCSKITDGEHITPELTNNGIPLLSAKDVRTNYLDFSNVKYVSEIIAKKSRARCNPEKGDILVVSRGATVGRCTIVDINDVFCLMGSVLLFKPLNKYIDSKYLEYYFKSDWGLQDIIERSGATAQQAVYIRDMKEFGIPLPPYSEQQEIVSRVESLFDKADAIEKQYEILKAKIDSLPQAILHKAFKGELSEQLDSDGDARELLREIEELKQVQQDKGKKRKSNTTKSVDKKVKSYVEKDEVLGMVAETKEELQPKVVKLKPTNTEIYKRTLLAAEIVYQLKDTNTLGHLKLQKMLYLCQEIGNMNLPMNFLKQAMGPYDNQLARSLDKQFVIKKWFEYQNGALLKYKPLESCGKHKDDFFKFFENEIEQINYIINKFTKFTSNQIEAVATLYACWKEAIDKKELITDRLIIAKFYQWSKEKEKFREENLIKALAWMRRNGVYPNF